MDSSIFLKNHSKKRIRERERDRELEDKEREGDRMKEREREREREGEIYQERVGKNNCVYDVSENRIRHKGFFWL